MKHECWTWLKPCGRAAVLLVALLVAAGTAHAEGEADRDADGLVDQDYRVVEQDSDTARDQTASDSSGGSAEPDAVPTRDSDGDGRVDEVE